MCLNYYIKVDNILVYLSHTYKDYVSFKRLDIFRCVFLCLHIWCPWLCLFVFPLIPTIWKSLFIYLFIFFFLIHIIYKFLIYIFLMMINYLFLFYFHNVGLFLMVCTYNGMSGVKNRYGFFIFHSQNMWWRSLHII